MLRWLGAALILSGGLLARRTMIEGGRAAQRCRRELAAAFEAMEAEVRLLLTPIPALLRGSYGAAADVFFTRAAQAASDGAAPAEAWRRAAEALPLPDEERAAIGGWGGRLDGDAESVCAALSLAAKTMRSRYDENESRRPDRERLTSSICICISLFICVLML